MVQPLTGAITKKNISKKIRIHPNNRNKAKNLIIITLWSGQGLHHPRHKQSDRNYKIKGVGLIVRGHRICKLWLRFFLPL